ncbi:MAG: hypothetical protein AAF078_07535, partial [Planctomycetota bacterium]
MDNRSRDRENDAPWWMYLLGPPFALLLMPFVALLMYPAVFAWLGIRRFKQFQHRRLMASRQRTVRWQDIQQLAANGDGTILVEGNQKTIGRVWWTKEHVESLAAEPIPAIDPSNIMTNLEPPEICYWFDRNYFDPASGRGKLVVDLRD